MSASVISIPGISYIYVGCFRCSKYTRMCEGIQGKYMAPGKGVPKSQGRMENMGVCGRGSESTGNRVMLRLRLVMPFCQH